LTTPTVGQPGEARTAAATAPTSSPARLAVSTICALLAFASNSLLCRLALSRGEIDPATFTSVRLVSGAAALTIPVLLARRRRTVAAGNWGSAAALAAYAVAFSFAYVTLEAGTGALLLFGAVQATMIGASLAARERTSPAEWLGLVTALAGLLYLVSPGLTAPPASGAALMAAAGVAWGVYSLRGRRAAEPVLATAGNFLRSAPLALAASGAAAIAGSAVHATAAGLALALASGVLASGGGYVVWYAALPHLSAVRASTVQLVVPVLGAAGGIALLGEAFTGRLAIAAALILGGVGVTLSARRPSAPPRPRA
jgi:drug/metabolite transporter (DMT)-like permease